MMKIALAAVLLAGIVGWAVREDPSFMPGVLKADCL